MADKKFIRMTTGIDGVEVAIWYNDINLRIGAVTWNIPEPGLACRLRVWDSNISDETPVVDRTEGQGSGSESVPGNYQVVEVSETIDGEPVTWFDLPSNLSYIFSVRTI